MTITKKAFTLVEVMVVVVVLAVLVAMTYPIFTGVMENTSTSASMQTVESIARDASHIESLAVGPSNCTPNIAYAKKAVSEVQNYYLATGSSSQGPHSVSVATGSVPSTNSCVTAAGVQATSGNCVIAIATATGTIVNTETIKTTDCDSSTYLQDYIQNN